MDESRVAVRVTQVDERDISWEEPSPCYRVYLHGSGETATGGWTDTYDITGADVLQVIDWAQRQAGDRLTYAVAMVRDNAEHGRGLVWVVGADGNDNTEDDISARAAQQRMLLRRQSPIGIPEADQAPAAVHSPYSEGA